MRRLSSLVAAFALAALVACGAAAGPTALQRATWKGEARVASARNDFAACATALENARLHYDAAACHARAGHPDLAFAALERAPARDLIFLDVDPDLAPLRTDARWPAAHARLAKRVADFRATVNAELVELYLNDQTDRMVDNIDWNVIGPRDREREARATAILAAGRAKAADDYFHIAMILQHSHAEDATTHARELCLKAIALDPHFDAARWLAAAALDRSLMNANKPQKYGTQYQRNGDGPWVLWDVDPATTDLERAEWNVPPLAAAKAHAEAMNAK
jgi:hypothetical protein